MSEEGQEYAKRYLGTSLRKDINTAVDKGAVRAR